MTQRSTAEVLLNAGAGKPGVPDEGDFIRDHFAACGMQANVTLIRDASKLEAAARRAVAARPDVVVVGGGDGTLAAVAAVVAKSGIPLGILPLGTYNHFAKDAGIPLDLASAVATVREGRVAEVDVGRVNGRLFLNNSSLGVYPRVVKIRDEIRHRLGHGKQPAFVWAALLVLRRFPFLTVEIDVEGKLLRRRTPLVFIGNNSYEVDGLHVGSRKQLDGGHLSMYIVNRTDRLGLISLAARAMFGRMRDAKDFEMLRSTRVEVTTGRSQVSVATDGEVCRLAPPLVYAVEKGALLVVVPQTAATTLP